MNGNVKAYLGIAIIVLWIHTIFTAHELVNNIPQSEALNELTSAISKRVSRLEKGLTLHNKEADDDLIGTKDEFHVVFSTDCSTYQHWQSIVCFFSAARVRIILLNIC